MQNGMKYLLPIVGLVLLLTGWLYMTCSFDAIGAAVLLASAACFSVPISKYRFGTIVGWYATLGSVSCSLTLLPSEPNPHPVVVAGFVLAGIAVGAHGIAAVLAKREWKSLPVAGMFLAFLLLARWAYVLCC